MRKLLVSFTILIVVSYSCRQKTPSYVQQFPHLEYDTASTAILAFQESTSWIFDSTYVSDTLLQAELLSIDSFVVKSVDDFNNRKGLNNSEKALKIDLDKWNYRKQIIVARNRFGEKEVWVNCFFGSNHTSWTSRLVTVDDGGTCYFNFKINLTQLNYHNFRVNSLG